MRNALSKINYIILSIGSDIDYHRICIIEARGVFLPAYNPDTFCRLLHMYCTHYLFTGYLLNVVGIIYITKKNN